MEDEFPLSPWPITQAAFEGERELSTSRKQTAAEWRERAKKRQATIDELCWNEGVGMYFDYDTKAQKQARYESVTTLWPLWAGCASDLQADILVHRALPKFEVAGGLVSGTEESRGIISLDRPNRQWDYPFGMSAQIGLMLSLTLSLATSSDPCLDRFGPIWLFRGFCSTSLQMGLHDDPVFCRL